ncbi:MAG: sulfur carrier protein ThiS [Burkholderiaceae bacterium]|jgi:sulfur carrier protein|nr:sulfur carrier protein ThiS [Burkholderiaceae bacterium]
MTTQTFQSAAQPAAPAQTIGITLDGQSAPVARGSTLADLLAQLGHAPDAVSTAVNGEFVARAARAAYTLAPGDQVLLFHPIVGG